MMRKTLWHTAENEGYVWKEDKSLWLLFHRLVQNSIFYNTFHFPKHFHMYQINLDGNYKRGFFLIFIRQISKLTQR